MSNSLVKFKQHNSGNGRGRLYWGRAHVDGLPFRGPYPPTMTEDEFDTRVVRIADPCNGTFRTWDEVENKAYLDVVDKITNNWAALIYVERWRDKKSDRHVVYIEWAEYYLEDGSPAQGISPGGTISYGQQGFQANPFASM